MHTRINITSGIILHSQLRHSFLYVFKHTHLWLSFNPQHTHIYSHTPPESNSAENIVVFVHRLTGKG